MKPNFESLDKFLQGYLTAAFWTNDDDAPSGEYSTSGRPEEMWDRLSEEAFRRAEEDCALFVSQYGEAMRLAGLTVEQAGQDFWLTRNHHGSGFWDRDLPENTGDELTKAAHAAGEVELYAGDDGKLYFC